MFFDYWVHTKLLIKKYVSLVTMLFCFFLDFQLPSDSFAKPSTCNPSPLISEDLEELKFLDSVIESSETDWQNINISMESMEESLNLSQLVDFNCDFSSEIPLQEQSYNLNSISAFTSELEFWSVPRCDQAVLQTLVC